MAARGVRIAGLLVATATLLLVATSLVALGWFNWPSADDFCNTVLVQNGGIRGALHWLYTQWSGRVLTGAVMYATFAWVDVPTLHIVSATLGALFVLSALQVARFVAAPGRAPAALWAFCLAAMTGGLYLLLGQTVFWPTGGIVYLLPLVLLLHWLRRLRDLLDTRREGYANGYWFVVSAMLGNSIELVVPIAIAYAVIAAAPVWAALDPRARRSLLVRGSGLVLGAVVLVTAPGNFLRGNATPNSFELVPGALAAAYADMVAAAARSGWPLLIIVAGILVAALVVRLWSHGRHAAGSRARIADVVALIIGGFASLVPVLAAPAQFAPRNAIYLLLCLFMAAMLLLAPRIQDAAERFPSAMLALAVLALVGALASTPRLEHDRALAAMRRDQQLDRDARLRATALHDSDVDVAPIKPYPPPTLHAIDVSSDPGNIVNQCVARYYGLRAVTLRVASTAP